MDDAKSVPENDVGSSNVFVGVGGYPFRETACWVAGGLRDVAACRMDLTVVV